MSQGQATPNVTIEPGAAPALRLDPEVLGWAGLIHFHGGQDHESTHSLPVAAGPATDPGVCLLR